MNYSKTITIFLILIALAGIFWFSNSQPNEIVDEPVFCTQEAKMCPDGSYVGRTGPKCEFTTCPGN